MRKLIEAPLGLLFIEDHTLFTGFLEDDSEDLGDPSFYDYDGTDSELDSQVEGYDAEITKTEQLKKSVKQTLMSKDSKIHKEVSKKVNGLSKKEKKLLKGIKERKSVDDSYQHSESDSDIKADHHEESQGGLNRKHKLFKKPKAYFSAKTGEHRHNVAVDEKAQRKTNHLEVMQKKRGAGAVKIEFATEVGSQKMRNAMLEEENSLDLREADTDNEEITAKTLQRRKKLCKAAELTASGDKGHRVKGKLSSMEVKGKMGEKGGTKGKDYSLVENMQRKKLEGYMSTPHESVVKASPSKSFKQGLHKEQKPLKEDGGLVRAEHPSERGKKLLLRKSTGDSLKSSNHRELKQEDVAGSSSSGNRPGSNKNLMPSVIVSGKKAGQTLCASLETVHSVVKHRRRAIEKVCDNGVAGEEVSSGVTEGADGMKEPLPDEKGSGHCSAEPAHTDVGWVMCDSCCKWRCIPSTLADMIESTNCGWLCKDNPNKKFADCSVPQEKSNSEINKELEISEVSEGDEKHPAIDSKLVNGVEHQSKTSGQMHSTWTLIKHNIFLHRRRKSQTIDEQMECMCKPSEDGGAGCGEDCLNRMLSLECLSQTCPCGDLCSNQQFQRRLYTKVGWFRCGKKGFGLQVLENVSKGAFIIEYVGEVLDMAAYEARQKDYAIGGQKHFYFMTLNSTEVIDACFKGNLGRFINHSCEPNCKTEKWMVNGEVCIGLFAVRDLKKGEEITFNYNFVRVCGAAAKKCLCGSRECRGFIGGDPMTPRAVVQSDSDEDDPEPIMIEESSEEESRIEDGKVLVDTTPDDKAETILAEELENKERSWMLSEKTKMQGAQLKAKSIVEKSTSANGKRLTYETDEDDLTVEEKLNKLVDESGGLCKGHYHAEEIIARKYLKLLVCDLANGEESRSTRELLMVLDALLKTQSRGLLTEINRNNGFQLLHKMMIKRSRKDYKQIPIIRKLLKVLHYLAVKRILSTEQLNSEPTRPGAESLKDTICLLCRHADTEIQQMAHQFSGKWLKKDPAKPLKRGSSDLSKWRLFPNKHNQQENSGAGASEDETSRKRKRPSRWDQPSQEVLDTTLAGGLPQSFWPFNANNLLVGKGQQSSISDHSLRQSEGALSDELGTKHPCPPFFPAADIQHQVDTTPIGTGVVSGIPVEHFTAGSSVGYMSQQGPICIGIPVSQFHGTPTPGTDSSYMPRMFASTNHIDQPPPDGQIVLYSSNVSDVHEQQQHEVEAAEPVVDKAEKEAYITFGISHSQFFQQMHGKFGSVFHPWQLQCLMAPHAWGPFLSGDARSRDFGFANESASVCRQQPEYRALDESGGQPTEPHEAMGAVGFTPEAEPPVPGLSPPLPPPPPPSYPFSYSPASSQTPKRTNNRTHMENDQLGRGNVSHQQFKSNSWRPQRWNSPRWSPRFQGNKFRNPGFRRDNYNQRNNRQNFPRQGPLRSNSNWEDSSSRQPMDRNWGFSNSRGMDHDDAMDMEADARPYGACGTESFQDSGNPSGSMPLERPWGYGQDNYNEGDPNHYQGEFSHERGQDSGNSWGANH